MSIKPNYIRGGKYFWAPRATLACLAISRSKCMTDALKCGYVPLFVRLGKNTKRSDYLRVGLVTIRTKREIDATKRRFKRLLAGKERAE